MQQPQRELDIKLGAPVYAAGGRHVGNVDRVVVDPATRRVTDLVVHAGVLLTRDVAVPGDLIEEASPAGVRLSIDGEEIDRLPDFVETAYVPLLSQDTPPLITWEGAPDYEPEAVLVPAASLYTPEIMPYAPRIVEERKNVPPNTTEVTRGTPVVCLDGPLGAVQEVRVDPSGERVSTLVVGSGEERWLVPADAIEVADASGIRLRVRRRDLQRLAGRPG